MGNIEYLRTGICDPHSDLDTLSEWDKVRERCSRRGLLRWILSRIIVGTLLIELRRKLRIPLVTSSRTLSTALS